MSIDGHPDKELMLAAVCDKSEIYELVATAAASPPPLFCFSLSELDCEESDGSRL
jgi:hypothetical protein